ncbi:MAG TPA: hypothetical protein VM286_08585 [Candidatus Thermoplasmatota archaeon]|nr:hypothetical protein [Candidatus Thermoplasmatota archaeon]
MRSLALLAVLVLVAGCLGTTTDPGTTGPPGNQQAWGGLQFRAPIDLGSKARPPAAGTNCQDSAVDGDCGLGEPEVEVAGDGTVYVSGVCCLTVPPPVYVSRDGGKTFKDLATPGVREQFGIEGDFAIDAEGRVYFADIEFAATFQVTVWDKDGSYLRHTKWPAPPLVDRDWIRAEGDGILYYAYNTGSATNLYKSTDAGATWSPTWIHQSGFGLGNLVHGEKDGSLCIVGGNVGGRRTTDCTLDGGLTWKVETSTVATGGNFPVGAFDEAGNLYLGSDAGQAITVARRTLEGRWLPPVNVSGPGTHKMPWMAAGRDGAAAIAWYGANATSPDLWMLHVAVSRDHGVTWADAIADPIPVFHGDLGRDLLDFFQVEVGPDGGIHVAYSSLPVDEGNEEQLHYVRSEPDPTLAPVRPFNGPN